MKKRWILLAEIIVLIVVCTWVGLSLVDFWTKRPEGSISIKVKLHGARDRAYLYRDENGQYLYLIINNDGTRESLDPQEFAQRIHTDQNSRSGLEVFLNVSSPMGLVWVLLGFFGQVLFTGRMIVQWFVSQKHKKSVVPPIFWWMSLLGSTMLLIYFLWRMDPIGVLGQAFGWFVYVHNLWLIHREHKQPKAA